MRLVVFRRTLRDRRRSLIGWLIGMALLTLFSVLLYPTVREANLDQVMQNLPEVMREMFSLDQISTPAGYLNGRQFALTAPLLVMIFSIGWASDVTAGEEERHTMDILLAHPIPRTWLVLEKFAAVVAGVFAIQLVQFLSILLTGPMVDLDVPVDKVAAVVVAQGAMGVAFGALALALGCLTGVRGFSRGVTSAVAVASYLVSAFAPVVDWLQPVKQVSLFYQGQGYEPILNGWGPEHLLVTAGTAAALTMTALWFFQHRDVAV
jgi:ABC-2 type transport system permease protein